MFQDDGDCPKDKLLQAAEKLINIDALPCKNKQTNKQTNKKQNIKTNKKQKTVGILLEDAPGLPVEKGKIDTIPMPTSIQTETVKDMSIVQTSVFL